jgi:hypothetical protein
MKSSYIINKTKEIGKNDLGLANAVIAFILIMGSAVLAMLLVFLIKLIFE